MSVYVCQTKRHIWGRSGVRRSSVREGSERPDELWRSWRARTPITWTLHTAGLLGRVASRIKSRLECAQKWDSAITWKTYLSLAQSSMCGGNETSGRSPWDHHPHVKRDGGSITFSYSWLLHWLMPIPPPIPPFLILDLMSPCGMSKVFYKPITFPELLD